jgi:hypothetical protein
MKVKSDNEFLVPQQFRRRRFFNSNQTGRFPVSCLEQNVGAITLNRKARSRGKQFRAPLKEMPETRRVGHH